MNGRRILLKRLLMIFDLLMIVVVLYSLKYPVHIFQFVNTYPFVSYLLMALLFIYIGINAGIFESSRVIDLTGNVKGLQGILLYLGITLVGVCWLVFLITQIVRAHPTLGLDHVLYFRILAAAFSGFLSGYGLTGLIRWIYHQQKEETASRHGNCPRQQHSV